MQLVPAVLADLFRRARRRQTNFASALDSELSIGLRLRFKFGFPLRIVLGSGETLKLQSVFEILAKQLHAD